MQNYTRNLRQAATYWPPGALNAGGGVDPGAPEPISVRWEDKRDLVRDADGEQVVSSAQVYVPRPLESRGWLALGEHADAEPRDVDGARQILNTGADPNLRQTTVLSKVWLK